MGVMRIGIDPNGDVRALLVADVLRRYLESRGRPTFVVAPYLDLTKLNVPPADMDSGHVDLVVSVAETVGEVPRDDLGARLLLLATAPDCVATIAEGSLSAARAHLHRWRRDIAFWAQHPSAPISQSYATRVREAFVGALDPSRLVQLLRELGADDSLTPGARFETAMYLDRVLALDLAAQVGSQ